MIPVFLKKEQVKARDAYENIKVLKSIPAIAPRVEKAFNYMEEINRKVNSIKNIKSRKYTDEEVFAAIDSPFNKIDSMESIDLIIELNMNPASFTKFLQQREFCKGGTWINTQDRVMSYLSNTEEELAHIRTLNSELLTAWKAGRT